MSGSGEAAVVSFEHRKANRAPRRHPKHLMEQVYAAGSLEIRADDQATKLVAALLQTLGLLAIEEIRADGTIRPFERGDARSAASAHPWRVLKPATSGSGLGVPEAGGALA